MGECAVRARTRALPALATGHTEPNCLLPPAPPRPSPPRSYIAYESQLDELREARRASRGISGKRGFAEWCITRRIHFVYERATRKFR